MFLPGTFFFWRKSYAIPSFWAPDRAEPLRILPDPARIPRWINDPYNAFCSFLHNASNGSFRIPSRILPFFEEVLRQSMILDARTVSYYITN